MMMVTNETISWRRLGRVARGVAAAMALLFARYFAAGLTLGAIPRRTVAMPAAAGPDAGADALRSAHRIRRSVRRDGARRGAD